MHTLSKYHTHTVSYMHGHTLNYTVCFCVQTTQTHSLSKSLNNTQCLNQTCTLFVQITVWLLLLGVATNNIQNLEILTQLVFCSQLASLNITLCSSPTMDHEPVPLSPPLSPSSQLQPNTFFLVPHNTICTTQ